MLGYCEIDAFGIIIKGGKFAFGCIFNGRSLEGIYILKWKKLLDVIMEDSCL